MAKPMSLSKRELEKKRQGKRLEKQQRKDNRKATKANGTFEDMIAYVDENGVIMDTPPVLPVVKTNAGDIEISTPRRETAEYSLLTGRIEYFNADKGYGFIKNSDNAVKYFFHVTSTSDQITEGMTVNFGLERGQRGMNAVNITIKR